ncbi:MAG: DUF4382 domain-containing protein [Pseudomonadota bacterium]
MTFPNQTQGGALATLAACAALLGACGGGGSASVSLPLPPPAPVSQDGTLRVSLTDAPACGFDAVNITVAKVRIHQSASAGDLDAGWTDITLNPARKINLLSLNNGALDTLGQAALGAGHYSQLRLLLAANTAAAPLANSAQRTGGAEVALDAPSAAQSGIKLIQEFDVAAGTLVDLTLDFDACRSIVARGNGSVSLKPVISIIPMVTSGAIVGALDPALAASHPVISAQVGGVVVKSTVPDAAGAFTLAPIAAGSYSVVITADAHASAVVGAVPVTAKASTVLATGASPLSLPASLMGQASGSVLPVSAEARVRATQSVGGQTVTIGAQGADLVSGAYALNLPKAAPLFIGYGALPIVPLPQATGAASYALEAAALGYQTQSVPIDILLANAQKNFTLTP